MNIPFCKPGDRIGISATARWVCPSEIETFRQFLHSKGFETVVADNIFAQENQFAGTDIERAAGFQKLLDDSSVKAIINARGGYGTIRMIDKVDFTNFLSHPKWLCGFSDFTVILSHVYHFLHLPSIHSPMAISFNSETDCEALGMSLLEAITGKTIEFQFENIVQNNVSDIEGILIGGNLSVLYSMIGSGSFTASTTADGVILFIEDIDEYLYHIDRMMVAFKRAGILDNIKGLLIGGMTDMKDNAVAFGKSAYEIIGSHGEAFNFPLFFNFPVGHFDSQRSIRIGQNCRLHMEGKAVTFTQTYR